MIAASIFEASCVIFGGIWVGAAIYGAAVESPSRESDVRAAQIQVRNIYKSAAIMQAGTSNLSLLTAVISFGLTRDWVMLASAVCTVALLGITVVFILPINRKILGEVETDSELKEMMETWQKWHILRTVFGMGAFLTALSTGWK
ncbi:hypothetical protein HK100_008227 [Physocladia obscura]|uniref:DUF1772 domain-containing protein n=1 Tax=Physocladia obscura TaxID=109957 RepID=A0AAD5SNE2_9FUNG|nr:hypothetical protein HK100_008227 [Physocladia obscura]